MRAGLSLFGAMALLVAACAATRRTSSPSTGELIVYETVPGPFCGRCDSMKLTVTADGLVSVERGHWAGRYKDWRVSKQTLRATPAQAALFRSRLAPYRPSGSVHFNGPPHCKLLTSDLPEVSISWSQPGQMDRLTFDFGCDTNAMTAMREALRDAPTALGVESPLMIPRT